MTELARTSTQMKELFELVDLEPMPQSRAVDRALEYWKSKRGDRATVSRSEIDPLEVPRFASYIFMYEAQDAKHGDYRLTYAGDALAPVLGDHHVGDLLATSPVLPFAERARHLFELVLKRGEPVGGAFHGRFGGSTVLYVEILAAPVEGMDNGAYGIFGALAYRHLEHGWEDQPSSVG